MQKLYRETKRISSEYIRSLGGASEHSIALGFAVGTFVNIVVPGVSFLIAVIVMFLYKPINKLSLFIALALWNPVTLVPVYFLSYNLSNIFFGPLPAMSIDFFTFSSFFHLSRTLFLGNLLIGGIISVVSYFAVFWIVIFYRQRKKLQSLKPVSLPKKEEHNDANKQH
ncbi:MAG: DUF2062 domain-containing protein [Candidatus Woesearchaeota archaeon]